MNIKPGWQTTEFWFSALATAWTIFGHSLPPVAQAVIGAVVPAAYSIARAIAKRPLPPLPGVPLNTANNTIGPANVVTAGPP